jgi:iron(III) transport system substrate-binding protein
MTHHVTAKKYAHHYLLGILTTAFLLCSLGCLAKPENEVVVYAALDRDFSQPILQSFERAHEKTTVSTVFDVEASKTVGLVKRIEAEKDRPRCDVFWNNELLHTIRLAKKGLLEPRRWDIPSNWPAALKAEDGTWVAVAARARVLLVNKDLLPDPAQYPSSVQELADPKWKKVAGVALPLYGTTATHFTIMNDKLGSEKADQWFKDVAANATVLSGNKQVALAVSAGQLQWGLTDTDDAIIEVDRGAPVAIAFPDQASSQMGTLLLPTSVAVIRNAPHPVAAGKLADRLVSEDVEGRLAIADSAQIPLRPNSKAQSRLAIPSTIRWADVDYVKASDDWESMQTKLQTIFTGNSL